MPVAARGNALPKLIAKPLPPGERLALARALVKAGLPADDVDATGRLFWRFETEDRVLPVGYGGLEAHGRDALLRSVLVLPPARNRGVGRAIVRLLEVEAMTLKCRAAWLITADAAPFFERLGYTPCDRAKVPAAIRATKQFATLCPASATVMTKRLRS
jgi:N-acetylglutamate synthase-like GNAT family acetyltransferase